jgi:hypothetical protein
MERCRCQIIRNLRPQAHKPDPSTINNKNLIVTGIMAALLLPTKV